MARTLKKVAEEQTKEAVNNSNTSDKKKNIANALAELEKEFGKGTVIKGRDRKVFEDGFPHISTQCLSLDKALGIGGVPRGRIIEIYGPESSGKTTLTLHIVAEAQNMGGFAAFIDAEHALDMEYAKNLGVDVDELMVAQPNNGEQALEIAEKFIRSGVDVVVIDSVSSLVPKAEIEGSMGDSHMGLQARLMSQACRKLTAAVAVSGTALIFINQLRSKIGVMFGSPETTSGGNALKFYSSVRMDIRRIESEKTGDEITGNRVRVKIIKNKMAPPFKQAEFSLVFGKGIDTVLDLLDNATEAEIITKSGSWYSYGDTRIGQGKPNASQFLKDNPDIKAEIENRLKKFNNPPKEALNETAHAIISDLEKQGIEVEVDIPVPEESDEN